MIRDTTKRKLRILVIDDDPDVCQFLKGFLENHDYEVDYLTNPAESLTAIKKDQYQIILMDIRMPEVEGPELLGKIREIDDDICVIVLSGYPSFENAREMFRLDCYDFLPKPFENEDLLNLLSRAIKDYGYITDLNQKATETIASRLLELRGKYKLSLRQLANRSGLSPSLIHQIERAQTTPSIATISRIAAALNSRLEHFFKGL